MTRVAEARWMEGGRRRTSVRPLSPEEDGDRFSSSIAEAVQRALADRTSAPERREGVLTLVLGEGGAETSEGDGESAPAATSDSGGATGLVTMVPAAFTEESFDAMPSVPSLAPSSLEDGAEGLADKALALAAAPPSLVPAPEVPERASVTGDRATPAPRMSREEASGVHALFRALARPLAEAAASIDPAHTPAHAAPPPTAAAPLAPLPTPAPHAEPSPHHAARPSHEEHRAAAPTERAEHVVRHAAARSAFQSERDDHETDAASAPPERAETRAHDEPVREIARAPLAAGDAAPPSALPVTSAARPTTSTRPSLSESSPLLAPETDEAAIPAEHVRYAALDAGHAKVELAHPTLGRLELEVRGEGAGVDVTMLTRSLGASIALRAAEASLRSDLGRRSTELRTYRVRTEAGASSSRTDDDEETT